MAIEKFILDESNKEKRERALGRTLTDAEHGKDEKETLKFQTILGDAKHEKLFGELMRTMYGDESNGLFERLASEDANMDDIKKINTARYEFQDRLAKAEVLRAGLADGDIPYLASRNEEFDAISGLLKDDKRTADVIRDHFYRLAMQGDSDTLNKIAESQKKLKATRESPTFKKYDQVAEEMVKRYGFDTKDWSILEEGNYTKTERREVQDDVWKKLSWRGKTLHYATSPLGLLSNLDLTGILGGLAFKLDPLLRGINQRIGADEKETKKFIKEHLKSRGEWFTGMKTRSIMKQVGKLEDLGLMEKMKDQFDFLGGVLAGSISKDKQLLRELVREAKGGEAASAIDKTKPMTFADLKASQGQLNDANYKNAFKSYLTGRRTEGLNTAGISDYDKDQEIDRFNKQYGENKKPGFFTELLAGLMRMFSNEKRPLLNDAAVWTP